MTLFDQGETLFKVLSDKTRLKILNRIHHGEQCGCDLLEGLDIAQPTLSHHLKVLKSHGLIKGTKEKTKVKYTLDETMKETVKTLFTRIMDKTPTQC